VVGLAKELGICWNLLYRWRDRQRKAAQLGQEKVEQQRAKAMREEIATLKSALGEKVLEVNFFKGALQKVEAQRQRLMRHGGAASTTRSGK
jgi:transposase-like protein